MDILDGLPKTADEPAIANDGREKLYIQKMGKMEGRKEEFVEKEDEQIVLW